MRQRIFLWMMVLAVAIIFSAVTAYSGTISLPKTGQETCYNSAGTAITCDGTTGQDGDLKVGEAWPVPTRFTIASGADGDGSGNCLKDELTGLIWRTKTDVGNRDWQGALDHIVALNTDSFCGYNDWRLPNVNELESLINYGVSNPITYLSDAGFTGLSDNIYYWSSTTYSHYTPPTGTFTATDAWAVSIGKGGSYIGAFFGPYQSAGVPDKDMSDLTGTFSAGSLKVWPVRGGAGIGAGL